jgi:hypothetical protein
MITVIIIMVIALFPISILWVRGINHMKENYPNYRGEDLFDEDNKNHVKKR